MRVALLPKPVLLHEAALLLTQRLGRSGGQLRGALDRLGTRRLRCVRAVPLLLGLRGAHPRGPPRLCEIGGLPRRRRHRRRRLMLLIIIAVAVAVRGGRVELLVQLVLLVLLLVLVLVLLLLLLLLVLVLLLGRLVVVARQLEWRLRWRPLLVAWRLVIVLLMLLRLLLLLLLLLLLVLLLRRRHRWQRRQ
jgi:hypothetical protein